MSIGTSAEVFVLVSILQGVKRSGLVRIWEDGKRDYGAEALIYGAYVLILGG